MKKILSMIVGLMSLLGLVSSCDDASKFMETEEFLPYCYIVKDATTIQIMGSGGLVIAEIEKTDWELFVQREGYYFGNEPLTIENDGKFMVDGDGKNSLKLYLKTNYENRPLTVAISGFLQPYTYMGEQVNLESLSSFNLIANVVVEETQDNPFYQKGQIKYSLMAEDTICVAQKSMPFSIRAE